MSRKISHIHTYNKQSVHMDEVIRFKEDQTSKYHMIGGDGPNSYSHNSEYQKQLLVSAENLIYQLISHNLDTQNPNFDPKNTFRIADFGCSVGPNTFLAVDNIIAAVQNQYHKSDGQNKLIPDFHVFFNDLADNDFNTLFKNLTVAGKPRYYAAGVAGSFHGRLFPTAALHLAHCSTALHWLSRVPAEVRERRRSYKGRVHYSGAGEEVKEAYWGQYEVDMEAFFGARAEELVGGGMMVMVVLGFPDGVAVSESSMGMVFDILGSCFLDMAKMGKISENKVDSFNLPFYYPSPTELKQLIEANGSFSIARIAKLATPVRGKPDPHSLARHLRAIIGVLIEEHFGNGMVDEFFELYLEKLKKSPISVDERYCKEASYFVFLKRHPR